MATELRGSVGRSTVTGWNGHNLRDDTLKVQHLLNVASDRTGNPTESLVEDGIVGPRTRGAIVDFQNYNFRWADGLVHPSELTIQILDLIAAGGSIAPPAPPASQYNYTAPGLFQPIAQPSSMACWATVGTMMKSWRQQVSLTIETAMEQCGNRGPLAPPGDKARTYLQLFQANTGLPANEHAHFAQACGFVLGPAASFTIDGWLRMLQSHGPLAVVEVSGPSSVHVRVVRGMLGDGAVDTTKMIIDDPDGGVEYYELFHIFEWSYEKIQSRGWERAQLWYYP